MPPQLYKVSKASAILGVSKEALRKWDSEGRVKAIRIPGGMRLYDITQISETLVAGEKNKKGNRVILYARVSSSKQLDDLIAANLPSTPDAIGISSTRGRPYTNSYVHCVA